MRLTSSLVNRKAMGSFFSGSVAFYFPTLFRSRDAHSVRT